MNWAHDSMSQSDLGPVKNTGGHPEVISAANQPSPIGAVVFLPLPSALDSLLFSNFSASSRCSPLVGRSISGGSPPRVLLVVSSPPAFLLPVLPVRPRRPGEVASWVSWLPNPRRRRSWSSPESSGSALSLLVEFNLVPLLLSVFLVYTRYMEFLALFLIAARFMAQMMSFLVKYICFCRKEIYFFKPSFMSSFLSRTGSLRFMDLHEIFF